LAENDRFERSGFGIDPHIAEPSGFHTAFMEKQVKPGDSSRNQSYGEPAKISVGYFNYL
jgi:hypothetical protein